MTSRMSCRRGSATPSVWKCGSGRASTVRYTPTLYVPPWGKDELLKAQELGCLNGVEHFEEMGGVPRRLLEGMANVWGYAATKDLIRGALQAGAGSYSRSDLIQIIRTGAGLEAGWNREMQLQQQHRLFKYVYAHSVATMVPVAPRYGDPISTQYFGDYGDYEVVVSNATIRSMLDARISP